MLTIQQGIILNGQIQRAAKLGFGKRYAKTKPANRRGKYSTYIAQTMGLITAAQAAERAIK